MLKEKIVSKISGGHFIFWLAIVSITILIMVSLWFISTKQVLAENSGGGATLDCLQCHQQPLTDHNKLGSGNQACYSCHDKADSTMKNYRLANGSIIQKQEVSQLCGQCHKERYDSWVSGKHGKSATGAVVPCISCHNPHQPESNSQDIIPKQVSTESSDNKPALDCLKCHQQSLIYHDKLGSGNQACYSCHDETDSTMKNYRLANDVVLQKSEVSQLCGQCHTGRYSAWLEGTHGIPGTVATAPCITCHNPHQPGVVFQNISKPPLATIAEGSPPPRDWLIIAVIAVVFLFGLGVVFTMRKENQ